MLTVENLETGYGKKQVLFGIDLKAAKGKVTAIIGPNGSGKSTALKSIFGLIPVWNGKVIYNNEHIANRTTRANVKDGIGFVPQGNRVFDQMTALENLEIGGLQLPKKTFQAELKKIWEFFPELEKRKKQNSGKLSGGEKQILALGRALIVSPKLLLMDEPSLGLSPKLVKYMMRHIQKINRKSGATILIVEQKVREVLEICHHIYSIKLGKIAYSGTPEALINDKERLKDLFL